MFKDSDCTSGASQKKTAGARSCCVLELLALKGLIMKCLLSVLLMLLPTGLKRFKLNDGPRMSTH